MASDLYKKPKTRLHREFLYLNHDAVINSLSALEAGKVDEIIEKSMEGGEGGLEAGIAIGPVKGNANKKKQSSIQAELTRKRTKFSAFQAWYEYLHGNEAIGTLRGWSEDVRTNLTVGDTLEFQGDLRLSPLGLLFASYGAFVDEASKAGSPMHMTGKPLAEARQASKMMQDWMTGSWPAYCSPLGVASPRVIARLEDEYFIAGLERASGYYTIVAQVDALLAGDERVSAIRILAGAPPTPLELDSGVEALSNFKENATGLGIALEEEDFIYTSPSVLIRPLAIFR